MKGFFIVAGYYVCLGSSELKIYVLAGLIFYVGETGCFELEQRFNFSKDVPMFMAVVRNNLILSTRKDL